MDRAIRSKPVVGWNTLLPGITPIQIYSRILGPGCQGFTVELSPPFQHVTEFTNAGECMNVIWPLGLTTRIRIRPVSRERTGQRGFEDSEAVQRMLVFGRIGETRSIGCSRIDSSGRTVVDED